MGQMHFDISIPLVSNIKLIVAKTNSWHTGEQTRMGTC